MQKKPIGRNLRRRFRVISKRNKSRRLRNRKKYKKCRQKLLKSRRFLILRELNNYLMKHARIRIQMKCLRMMNICQINKKSREMPKIYP